MEEKPGSSRKRRPHPARRARRITAAASTAAFVAMGAGMAHSATQTKTENEAAISEATSANSEATSDTTSTWAATAVTATTATTATATTVAAHTVTQGS